ncbi:MAG: hypothetical protein E6J70_11000 [Deltaproteobacteria bacterium]|nr:MAG: hypothetical protein E6J70_11000 [Deltaproteobacteria bacterium]
MRALTRRDLSRFLRTFARQLPCPTTLILTGGSEALVLGGTRPTGDVDFGLVVRSQRRWPEVEAAVAAAAREARVVVQYSSDLDRWSSVTIPPRRRRTRPYRRVGRLSVRLLEPACWAVYKLARYLDADVEDLRTVLRRERVPSLALARLCGESLRASPRSTQLFLFRRQVEHFLAQHGRAIWGRRFDVSRTVAAFHRAAGIGRATPR